MKKTFLIAATLLGTALWSCEDPGEKPVVDENGMVDVVIGVPEQNLAIDGEQTRLWTAPAGYVSWSPGDYVSIIDHGEANYSQRFNYMLDVNAVQGSFSGKLLAGFGPKTYYAYRQAPQADNFSRVGYVIKLGRHDIAINQGTEDIRKIYGDHVTMVSGPEQFDAESSGVKHVEFYNANCLIEASISHNTHDRLAQMVFDTVEFTVETTDGSSPFTTEATFDLTQIVDPTPGDNNDDLVIPFTDNDATKVDKMRTWIRYDQARHFNEFQGLGSNGTFGIAIVALPTDTAFEWLATVKFWNGDEQVGQLERVSRAGSPTQGLRVAALNSIAFTDAQWVTPAGDENPAGNTGGGNGNDDDDDQGEDEDDDDQGEDEDEDEDEDDQGQNNNNQG